MPSYISNYGYFRNSGRVYVDKRLAYCPYGQCGVRFENGKIILVSYFTYVIEIDNDGWLTCSGTYSATTCKHIRAFMKEYTHTSYYTAKKCYEENKQYNIYTGEFRDLQ